MNTRLLRWIRSIALAAILQVCFAPGVWSQQAPQAPPAQQPRARGARAERAQRPEVSEGAKEFMVPMRDGVKLATNVFLPEGTGPWPVVLTRTPYGKDGARGGGGGGQFTNAGYARVMQDCRGKFRSEGDYRPYEDDIPDGYDTVEWIAKQPWCNGKVGIEGTSAMGNTSNLAAASAPPHLVAAYVVLAPQSRLLEANFVGGAFKEEDNKNWMRGQGALDQVDGLRARPMIDERWKKMDLVHHIQNIKIPMYNVGGWYDIFEQGNLKNFMYLQNQGAEGAKGKQKLLMGAFGHGALAGDLAYPGGDRGAGGGVQEELRWFNYWLKGEDNGIMKEPAVKYYMMASARKGELSPKNGFRTDSKWPPKSTLTPYYLGDGLTITTAAPKAKSSSTAYKFDPANPAPTKGGANLTFDRGPMDQREIGNRPDYLRFQTAILEKDVAVAGKLDVDFYASTDGTDTDFIATLVDVYPDGYEALVMQCPLRARFRDGFRPEDVKMMKPGEPTRMKLDLWSTALTFEKGHRIALHITSSCVPRFDVNPNTGEAPGKSTMAPRVATNTIYHDAAHPTAIILPVVGE